MSSYIHFTEEQKQRAAAVDLEEFLRCRGEKLLSSGREKRLASDHSVTVRGNEWYDHAEERGGHAVSFVQRFYGLSYPDAVTLLLGGELGTAYPSAGERTEEPAKPFALPPANKDMRRVFAYLIKHRGIARDVVAHFAKAGLLYEDAEYHNAVSLHCILLQAAYSIPIKIFSSVIGSSLILTPTALYTAFAIAGDGVLITISPMDFAPNGPVGS